ncbi:hypothetical protein [Clostridium sp. 'White wine YQ']|uniref:hypothetical protein n=1 Tax=Clostridium sp. 'White wine YQ' TaxID=3027474 RepID=UPI002365F171|nr:hypothetical protein [Clostridium sp. 'White wine YQ']MDD7793845.1 hypothetical protein [Clostridium sp. 'White wine YQ']
MYDAKVTDHPDKYVNPENTKDKKRDISDRGYFSDKLTSSVLGTKTSYVPTDDLL